MDVGDVRRFDIDECSDFQCPKMVVGAVGVVPAGLIAVEARRVDGSVASAFLGRPAFAVLVSSVPRNRSAICTPQHQETRQESMIVLTYPIFNRGLFMCVLRDRLEIELLLTHVATSES